MMTLLRNRLQRFQRPCTKQIYCVSSSSEKHRSGRARGPRCLRKQSKKSRTQINAHDYKFKPGDVYSDFTCIQAEKIAEFDLTVYRFQHRVRSNYVYIDRDDGKNMFSVNFRTTPFDSTGKPHVLENQCFYGSSQFPVWNVYTGMLDRTIGLVNAMTAPDCTVYPFASTNEKDFRNLLHVYLDAVFKPKLDSLSFLHAGWRIEHVDVSDRNSPYTIRGVVYDKARTRMTDSVRTFVRTMMNSLLPDHTYAYSAGGVPLEIPCMTYQDLMKFYCKFYHPSNASFFSYGHFDLLRTMEFINENYLSSYEPVDNSFSAIPKQQRWSEPQQKTVSCCFDPLGPERERQNQIGIASLMCDITDAYESFVLNLLDDLLRKVGSGYFSKIATVVTSGNFHTYCGFHEGVKEAAYCMGMDNIRANYFEDFVQAYEKTVDLAIENGWERSEIEMQLHRRELYSKRKSHLPAFLNALSTAMWIHGGDLAERLRTSDIIRKFRENLDKDPKYLQKRFEHYFKQNKHRLMLMVCVDEDMHIKFEEDEKRIVDEMVVKMTGAEKQTVYETGLDLQSMQNPRHTNDLLPDLSIDDVRDPPKQPSIELIDVQSVPTRIVITPTNQVTHLRFLFNMSSFKTPKLQLLPFFSLICPLIGTDHCSPLEFQTMVRNKIESIQLYPWLYKKLDDLSVYTLCGQLVANSLTYNVEATFDLILTFLTKFNIDFDHLEFLKEYYHLSFVNTLRNHMDQLCIKRCLGLVAVPDQLEDQLFGLQSIPLLNDIYLTPTESLLQEITDFGHQLFDASTMSTAIIASRDCQPNIMPCYEKFLKDMPRTDYDKPSACFQSDFLKPQCICYITDLTPRPKYHCCKSMLTVPYESPDYSALTVLVRFLRTDYLIPLIANRNGASETGASLHENGILHFYSFYDPNVLRTLDIFDNVNKWLSENLQKLTAERLHRIKLHYLQSLDEPPNTESRGSWEFLYDSTQEVRLKRRARLLDLKFEDISNVVQKYFGGKPKHYGKVVIGARNEEILKQGDEKWQVEELSAASMRFGSKSNRSIGEVLSKIRRIPRHRPQIQKA